MRLYSGPLSMFGAKAQIAALEKGLCCEVILVPFGVARGYEPRHPEVARINPKGQVPVLVDGDLEIFDSTQIFEYFEDHTPNPALWPRGAQARAWARQLEHASDEVFFPNVVKLMAGQNGQADVRASATDAIHRYAQEMDQRLEEGPFLAGDFSYADIAFFMAQMFAALIGVDCPKDAKRLVDWRARLAARPAFQAVAGPMARYAASKGFPDLGFLALASEAPSD